MLESLSLSSPGIGEHSGIESIWRAERGGSGAVVVKYLDKE